MRCTTCAALLLLNGCASAPYRLPCTVVSSITVAEEADVNEYCHSGFKLYSDDGDLLGPEDDVLGCAGRYTAHSIDDDEVIAHEVRHLLKNQCPRPR